MIFLLFTLFFLSFLFFFLSFPGPLCFVLYVTLYENFGWGGEGGKGGKTSLKFVWLSNLIISQQGKKKRKKF